MEATFYGEGLGVLNIKGQSFWVWTDKVHGYYVLLSILHI